MEQPEFWNDQSYSQKLSREKSAMDKTVEEYENLYNLYMTIIDTIELAELMEKDGEELSDVEQTVDVDFQQLKVDFEGVKLKTLLSEKYDKGDCILSIHAGTGGVDAMDWASMLLRMYIRWCEKKSYKVTILDYQDDTEAGIKSATVLVEGGYSYGYLKNEKGVHRLVRISPFNAQGKRQTSFAMVEVVPDISDDISVEIDADDLRIDTYRSSGAGGQHVNKTNSAIRITHIPTGIVVTCQDERSQIQNKEMAMRILKAKLRDKAETEHKENIKELKGDLGMNTWGSQIRSYVFQPYTMVKDHRTSAEVSNVQGVMDGNLDYFIYENLKKQRAEIKGA